MERMVQRPASSSIPDSPGAYIFRDENQQPLYVGKAKSLRKRVANYFGRDLHPRTHAMVAAAADLDWIVTTTEVEALMLEYALIKEHRPRFNIRLVDDKSFPYLALTRNEEWPKAQVMRGRRRKEVQYFGPYAHAYAIRGTLDLLLRTFPVRTCKDSKFANHRSLGSPCLLFHIDRCSGPCVDEVTPEAYEAHVDGMARFLQGHDTELLANLTAQMEDAAATQEYERAARLRDQRGAVIRVLEKQELVTQGRETFDVIAVDQDELEASVVVLHVRLGRVRGRKRVILDKVEDVTDAEMMGVLLERVYADDKPPAEVLLPIEPDNVDLWRTWLSQRRGGPVRLKVPQRGAKRRIMETGSANAREEFSRHRLRRSSDHNARAKALRGLEEHLELPQPPLRIECYDISTIQGTFTVASMVVFEDGLPKKNQYRRFKIKTIDGQDDFASMEEVLRRRFVAYLAQRDAPREEGAKFSYPPSLIVIDGGPGQLGRAVKVLDELGLSIPVIGLAKRLEEVYFPGRSEPLQIPRRDEALYLLQRVRDEAHRFAITYHRTIRGKGMVDSLLDGVPGVGAKRRKDLLRKFGSLKRMRDATVDQLAEVIPASVARDLFDELHAGKASIQRTLPRG